VLNPIKQEEHRAKALDEISSIISQCSLREGIYRLQYEETDRLRTGASEISQHEKYRGALRELYVTILTFQATCACFLSKSTAKRITRSMAEWDGWDSLLNIIKGMDTRLRDIETQWKDLTYQKSLDSSRQQQTSQHEETVTSLRGIESEVTRLRTVIDEAQKNANRKALLESLTTIQPSSNYNQAREKHRGSGTNGWLLEDNKAFAQWKSTPNSVLWIHGKGSLPPTYLPCLPTLSGFVN